MLKKIITFLIIKYLLITSNFLTSYYNIFVMKKNLKKIIEEKLKKEFAPTILEVIDNSHLHVGHYENKQEGESHFAIIIKSAKLENIKKVEAHRLINKILQHEFALGVHALEIKIL